MRQILAFEGVQEARKFTFDCIDERLNNLNFSEGAFNKQFDSLYKQVVALQNTLKEQSEAITHLKGVSFGSADLELEFKSKAKKLDDKIISKVSVIVADALNKQMEGLNKWVSELQLVQKTEFEAFKKEVRDEILSLRKRVKSLEVSSSNEADENIKDMRREFNGIYNFVKTGMPAEILYYVSNYAKNKGLTLAGIQKKETDMKNATEAFFRGFSGMYDTYKKANITFDIAKKLWNARCYTQEHITIKSAEADLQWFDDAIKKYGTYSGEFFKAILNKHRIEGGVLKRTLFLSNFQPKGA